MEQLPPFLESEQIQLKIRIELLGKTITKDTCVSFEQFLELKPLPQIIDVTGWSRHAIAALLIVCKRNGKIIGLQSGTSYLTPILVSNGPLLECLIDAILKMQADS
ncbi:hypothetical protein EU537_07265 [Candidatus Thorarchaeota archaeon]|nr:MAG: hypothetical protein EU537_07265 [Candidatus Thorarchaeota archaeon]